jgi:putative colanic acid biosynthesis acetyltransferase WcaF
MSQLTEPTPLPTTHHPDRTPVSDVWRVRYHQPSTFSRRHQAMRYLWRIVWRLFFRWVPPPFHGVRRAILRMFGARVHPTARVYPSAVIWAPWNLVMKRGSTMGPGVICYNVDTITIEENVMVSQYAHLCSATHDYQSENFTLVCAPIRLEQGCWVCADVFIHPGVTIGRNAVIGARSVVTRDMPRGMVCVGFPCAPLKKRFTRHDGG